MDDHSQSTAPMDASNCEPFLNALNELSAKYGIAIGGDAVLFTMEHEDFEYEYRANEDSKLILG